MTTCNPCQKHHDNPLSGLYNMRCLPCCARLVRSARPMREAQEAMLACIDRHKGAPTRPEIINTLKNKN